MGAGPIPAPVGSFVFLDFGPAGDRPLGVCCFGRLIGAGHFPFPNIVLTSFFKQVKLGNKNFLDSKVLKNFKKLKNLIKYTF